MEIDSDVKAELHRRLARIEGQVRGDTLRLDLRVGGPYGNYLLDRVVLNAKKLVHPVCRIQGWTPYYIYRDEIVDALQDEGITGLHFEEVEVV